MIHARSQRHAEPMGERQYLFRKITVVFYTLRHRASLSERCFPAQATMHSLPGTYYNNQCRLPMNQVYGKVTRKELRMMTDDERARYSSPKATFLFENR
ncbi:hypothetical protein ANCDUO_11228 [Ancylostoma duodenale]|uniref:Uncharacterized protein n=1 Tax=Ancylostoma duodenale TaxID=51022 RepID=A0A0C2CP99_9BILA|nr:hypothetical protein ANCDUO_11228 [Ancylostoma duodenale]